MKLRTLVVFAYCTFYINTLFCYIEQSTVYHADDFRDSTEIIRQAVPLDQLFIKPLRHLKPKSHPIEYAISGYVFHNAFWDSRQILAAGQGDYLVYPLPYNPDIGGFDINQKGQFNMLNTETRLRAEAYGPLIWEGNSFGVFEGDCWGNVLTITGLMRLRHAFMYLTWEHLAILIGQYWHPFFVTECFADTISFNGGSPIEPFAREPQVRLTWKYGDSQVTFAAASVATDDFAGPLGTLNTYARNAILPDINVGLDTKIHSHLVGILGNMHRIVPRLVTDEDIRTHASLMSFGVQLYAKFIWKSLSVRTKFIYMQNPLHLSMLGGYAVSCIDPYSDQQSYTNISSIGFWIDSSYRKNKLEPGCFLGYTKSLGASKAVDKNLIFTEGIPNVDYVFRISPRLRYFADPLVVCGELEYTRAAFGDLNYRAQVKNTCAVGNIRFIGALFYCF